MTYTSRSWPLVFGIAGAAGHGKNTVGDMIQGSKLLADREVVQLSFAYPLKQVAKLVFNLSDEDVNTEEGKNQVLETYGLTVRSILQLLGTELFRNGIHKDIWLHCFHRRLNEHLDRNPECVFVVTDVRFPNESEYLRQMSRSHIILVDRANKKIKESTHASEGLNVSPDCFLTNDGSLEDLRYNVDKLLSDLLQGK